jgi:hypothetical protein
MKFIRIGGLTFLRRGLFPRRLYVWWDESVAFYEVRFVSRKEQEDARGK